MSNDIAITVNDKNAEKINTLIAEAEGRATVRCANYDDVVAAVTAAEGRLAIIPKTLWDGATATYDDKTLPNSYSYRGESTEVSIARKGSRWVFTGAARITAKTASHGQRTETSYCRVTLAGDPTDILTGILAKARIGLRETN